MNYEFSDAPIAELKMSEEYFEQILKHTLIICVLHGTVNVSYGNVDNYRLTEGQLMLFPPGIKLTGGTCEQGKVLLLRLNDNVSMCDHYTLDTLYNGANMRKLKHTHIESVDMVRQCIHNLADNIANGLRCVRFLEAKILELLCYMRSYYGQEEMQRFNLPLLSANAQFMDFVWKTYREVRNVKEFAVKANCSAGAFNDKFKKITGITPAQWLNEQKARNVYHELCSGRKSLKEISHEYQFSSVSHLGTFCRNKFGKSPRHIRVDIYDAAEEMAAV